MLAGKYSLVENSSERTKFILMKAGDPFKKYLSMHLGHRNGRKKKKKSSVYSHVNLIVVIPGIELNT